MDGVAEGEKFGVEHEGLDKGCGGAICDGCIGVWRGGGGEMWL